MTTPAQANAIIDQYIRPNGVGAIDGPTLNSVLKTIVSLSTSGGSGPPVAAVLAALEQMIPGGAATLTQAVPPDPSNIVNIHFNHVPFMTSNGVLYSFIQGVFGPGFNMTNLVAAASAIQV